MLAFLRLVTTMLGLLDRGSSRHLLHVRMVTEWGMNLPKTPAMLFQPLIAHVSVTSLPTWLFWCKV